jgi:hypothetical protein
MLIFPLFLFALDLNEQDIPCPCKREAMYKDFPPGAAQQSVIVSPGCGSTTETTKPRTETLI